MRFSFSRQFCGGMGRGVGLKSDTSRHLSGRSVRVLAFGLRSVFLASRMIRLPRAYAGTGNPGTRSGERP
jgi:hypothetical protein